jgi:hypothetical protein
MSRIRRTNQGGSIVLFVVLGLVLTIGLIGGIYLLKNRSEQVRRDKAIAIIDEQTAKEKAKNEQQKAPEPQVKNDEVTVPGIDILNTNDIAKDLPVTGPEDNIVEIIGAGLLTFFALSYIKSRRQVSHL